MTAAITLDQVREAAHDVVAEQGPDFRYITGYAGGAHGQCAYVPSTDERYPLRPEQRASGAHLTGCLVGRVAERLGLMTDELASSMTGIAAMYEERRWGLGLTEQAAQYLSWLQVVQDTGKTWGEALDEAERDLS